MSRMKHVMILSALTVSVSGCANVTNFTDVLGGGTSEEELAAPADPFVQEAPVIEETALAPATAAPPPPPAAQTAEALDTTTPEQRAAATVVPESVSQSLGTTVVSLGSPTKPGLWLRTPLVSEPTQGRVTNPETGQSSLVSLLPLEGPSTAGSRMSLAALRLIGASLTALTEVEVSLEG